MYGITAASRRSAIIVRTSSSSVTPAAQPRAHLCQGRSRLRRLTPAAAPSVSGAGDGGARDAREALGERRVAAPADSDLAVDHHARDPGDVAAGDRVEGALR